MKKHFLIALMAMPLASSLFGQGYNAGAGSGGNGTNFTHVGVNTGNASTPTTTGNSFFGYNAGVLNTGPANTGVGYNCLAANTTGQGNTGTGYEALRNNTGWRNAAFGTNALYNNTSASDNTAIGYNCLFTNTTGARNTGFGGYALRYTTGDDNTAGGFNSLTDNTTGIRNTAFGSYSVDNNTTGGGNAGFGVSTLSANTTGSNSTACGTYALADVTSGNYNTSLGYGAGRGIASGGFNTIIGALNTTYPANGSYNTVLGAQTTSLSGGSYNTILGAQITSLGSISNTIVLADGQGNKRLWINSSGYAGFGTISPASPLDVFHASSSTLMRALSGSQVNAVGDPTGLFIERLETTNGTGAQIYGNKMGVYANSYQSNSSNPATGMRSEAFFGATTIGVSTTATGTTGSTAYGVNANASGANTVHSYGVKGTAYTGLSTATIGNNIFGVWGNATYGSTGSPLLYGVYGTANGGGLGTPTVYAGFFAGDVYCSGSYLPSDFKLKTNIEQMDGALGKIMQLKPSTYNYDVDKYKNMNLPQGKRYGFIAQELETVFPQLTKKAAQPAEMDANGKVTAEAVEFTAVNYIELIPVLTKAIQEQQAVIEELKAKIEANTEKVTIDGQVKGQKVEFSKSAALFQNTPNPLNNITFIDYYLPASTRSAFIKVIDNNGKLVQAFPLSNTGYSQLEMDCSNLAAGTYHYSLIIDNVIVDTKTMLVAKN